MNHEDLNRMRWRVVISSTLGNALEWFDFTVFGLFVGMLSKLFFPAGNAANSLLLAFATFGIAFVARPLGGIGFGVYADRHGRKKALVVMIMLMAVGTGLIGLLPTYAQIGLVAPLGILIARLMQGVSAGGEFGSASAMLIEFATPDRRGLYASLQSVSQSIAFILGAGLAYLLNHFLAPADLESWGWRIPFLLGMLIGPVGFFVRAKVDESPAFKAFQARQSERAVNSPLRDVLRQHPRELAVAFCLTAAGTAMTYVNLVYMPVYVSTELGLRLEDAQLGLVVVSCGSALISPLAGLLSDFVGRRMVVLPGILAFCTFYYILLGKLVAHPTTHGLWALQASGLLLGFLAGPLPALMTEIFPVGMRSTGASLVYNLAVMLFGGLAPFINTWLVKTTGDKLAPVYYLIFASLVGMVGLALHREKGLNTDGTVNPLDPLEELRAKSL